MGKVQRQFNPNVRFLCDVNGPGRRSDFVPYSVHQLRAGDIDVVGAIGDSLTAGNGLLAINVQQIFLQNKGLSWAIGGQGTWRQFLTLPNILKEYNSNLYGYSVANGYSFQTLSRFNTAEFGAMSRDLPHQARVLVHRITSDPKVNVREHWKYINVNIGGNDFCSDMCYYSDPYKTVALHEKNLIETLRILRDALPRTFVSVVTSPDVFALKRLTQPSEVCNIMHKLECPCLFANAYQKEEFFFEDVVREWHKTQQRVVDRPEFNGIDFTVVLQKFSVNLDIPRNEIGLSDFTFLSTDCFHLSQKGNAAAATSLWNNLFESYYNKSDTWQRIYQQIQCPNERNPFIRTRENSF
uniref:Phospholipase B1, membrane-associated n=1 Tax=Culicoides sonorensis TaxID=179676 RepID=A0A336KR02_CULSO